MGICLSLKPALLIYAQYDSSWRTDTQLPRQIQIPCVTVLLNICYPNSRLKKTPWGIIMFIVICFADSTLCEHPDMFYTPIFTLLYSRKGEMRGTQNEGSFSGLD